MSNSKSVKLLLAVVALLLLANLIHPLWSPSPAQAQDHAKGPAVAITGAGATAWILKGNNLYYAKFEQQFESIRIYGPEELPED